MSHHGGQRTVVHMVRHGEVHNPNKVIYGRMPDFHLSDLGHQMAKLSADSLAERDVTHVFSSPLERALETAAPFAAMFGVAIEEDERLIESASRFEGQRFAVGDGALRHPVSWWWMRDPFTPSWGERYRDIGARVFAAMVRARDAAHGHEAVCVSHQLPIEIVRRYLAKKRLWHNPRNRMVTLASITSFVFDDDQLVAVEYAEPAIELVPPHLRSRVVK